MYKIRGNLFCKILAVFVFTVSAMLCVGSVIGTAWLYSIDAHVSSKEVALSRALDKLGYQYTYFAGQKYSYTGETEMYEDTDFRFEIINQAGNVVYSNYKNESVVWSGESGFQKEALVERAIQPTATATPKITPGPVPTEAPSEQIPEYKLQYFTIKGYILEDDLNPNDDFSKQTRLFESVYQYRTELVWLSVASFLLTLFALVFLVSSAGRRRGKAEVCLRFLDKIPYDLFVAVFFCLVPVAALLGAECYNNHYLTMTSQIGLMIVLWTIGGELALLFLLSTVARLKAGGIIKSCLIYKLLAWIFKPVKKAFCWGLEQIKAMPMLKKALAIFGAVMLAEFLWMLIADGEVGMYVIGWAMERVVFALLLIYALVCMKKLRAGAKAISAGEEHYIDTKNMRGEFLAHAEDLNNIGAGISKAVEEKMKSERFKTELITNVSHDIKTPLTSIINYVDLLEKEEPENEKMREYLQVLSRQSGKLKKLIEDLIEASKASTGNLSVSLERCELGILLEQVAGEYEDKLKNCGLELVLTKPENAVEIMADGRHMWRIFDNLMNNVCKYAQSGTRVYLSLAERENQALVTFRNISRTQLNISGEELMERFVRGDVSRSTDGSGLGLSIAKSLAQLQKGEMNIVVDGDLFKVELTFNK